MRRRLDILIALVRFPALGENTCSERDARRSRMPFSRHKSPRLRLEDLIDLEMQFQADRERDSQELRRRDGRIGQEIDARRLADEGREQEMFLAWLSRVRELDPSHPGPGRQVMLFLEVVGLVLVLLGFGAGFGAVTGWLRLNPTEPVNAIFFWIVIVGIQLSLLLVWLIAIIPAGWLRYLPGAEAVQMLLRLIARALPLLVAWAAARMSPEHRLLLARLRGTLQSWSWIYGRIQFWTLVAMTQMFAVAYNVGAILAFVAVSYGNDPAFGWKSRLLTPEELSAVVETIALPWRSFWPAAAPTLEHIAVTRFSSLDPRYLESFQNRGGASDAWALWWPFLMACLVFYGLIPRIATLAISRWNARRATTRVKLDHGDFYKLNDRLTRPLVETQATTPELAGDEASLPAPRIPAVSPLAVSREPLSPSAPYPARHIVKWAGVNCDREEVGRLVRDRLHVEPAEVFTVGDLQGKGDEQTLRALERDGQGEVLMVVESWEPPIADYVDFLSDLRNVVGRERMIVVLLYNRDREGKPVAPRPRDVQVWRDQIATLGDPWICVEELVEGGEEEESKGEESTGEESKGEESKTEPV
jgi:hypothetical protein